MAEYDLGKYSAEIILDDRQFEAGMNNAESKLDSTEKKSQGFGKALGGLAAGAIAGVATALVGVGVVGVSMADDLKRSLNGLQASTGASAEEMESMEGSLKAIYNRNYGESFQDIADTMAYAKQATGFFGEELEYVTQDALMLRDTFAIDVEESIRGADALFQQFGSTGTEAMAFIAEATQKGLNRNGDLVDTIEEYSVYFKTAGLDAKDMFGILENASKAGVRNLDYVGDAFKEMTIRTKDGSKTTVEAYKSLGLNADQMMSDFAAGGEKGKQAYQTMMEALNAIEDPVKKNTVGIQLFGTKFEDLEAGAIEAMANLNGTITGSVDTLNTINEIKYDSFGEAIQGIGRNFQTGLLMPIGEMILPMLNTFANWINEKMPVIQSVFQTVFDAINSVVTVVYGFFKDNILPVFTELFNNVQTNFPTIQSNFETVFNAIWKVANTVWSFFKNSILPIFASLYNWIMANMPTIQSTFQTVFNKIVEVASGAWSFFTNNILPIFQRLFEFVQSKMPQIQSIIETAFGIISDVVKIVWDVFENLLLPVLKTLWDWVSPNIPKIQSIIEKAFSVIFDSVDAVVGVFGDVVEAIKDAIDWLTFWDNKEPKKKTLQIEERRTTSGGIAGGIPQYAVGTPFVPNDQLAVVHKGEAIIPAKYNPFNKRGKNTSSTVSHLDQSKHYNFNNLTIKSDNPTEFLAGLDVLIRSQ
jgi:phage-related minor tail protein